MDKLSLPIITPRQMQEIDQKAIQERGIASEILMGNAGDAVAQCIQVRFPEASSILCIVGKGNNGGDGLIAAKKLLDMGLDVDFLLYYQPEYFATETARIWSTLTEEYQVEGFFVNDEKELDLLLQNLDSYDAVVDAIFGIGLQGEVRGLVRTTVEALNESRVPVISVDVPSGLNAETGAPLGNAVRASITVTFGLPKIGFYMYPGPDYIGELVVAGIGFPEDLLAEYRQHNFYLTDAFVRKYLTPRKRIYHKGDAGTVCIIGGSPRMVGSVCMAAQAAYRSGAGIVYILVPKDIAPIVSAKVTEPIVVPLTSTTDGMISQLAYNQIQEYINLSDSVLIGPGMGRSKELIELMKKILLTRRSEEGELSRILHIPIILDADAIHNLKAGDFSFKESDLNIALTPHPGELGYLMEKTPAYINAHRFEVAVDFWKNYQKVLVLKGTNTVIASDDCVFVNPTGNPGMATGGSGDVLAGIIAALSVNIESLDVACSIGVFIHGLAADFAQTEQGTYSLIASDMIDYLPEAYKYFHV